MGNFPKTIRAELLAPAGSIEAVKAAVCAGADAVYMGGRRFGARAYAQSAADGERDELLEAIAYCHLHNVKLYMTVNTLFKDEELKELFSYMLPYYEAGVDAVIVQDLGAAACLRKWFPDLELHASTQMTITGAAGARQALALGFSRVVLARELSLSEIRRVYEETGAEIEAFVHGAMCYSYSGACFMSSLLGGRSGNRGRCAGTCRLCYESGGKKGYFLSMKDMCTLRQLPEMLAAGVYSMKIEGRMKSPAYTAGVVSVYRKYLDLALSGKRYQVDKADEKLLSELFDRGGTTSYLNQHNGRDMIAVSEKQFRAVDTAAIEEVKARYVAKEKRIALDASVRLRAGEPVTLMLRELCGDAEQFFAESKAAPANGEAACLQEASAKMQAGAVASSWQDNCEKQKAVEVCVCSEQCLETASARPAAVSDIEKQLAKAGGTCYEMERIHVDMEGALFVPVKLLNELRRTALAAFAEKKIARSARVYTAQKERNLDSVPSELQVEDMQKQETSAQSEAECSDALASALSVPKHQRMPEVRVCVELAGQLSAALLSERVDLIYLDEACFSEQELLDAVARCKKAGKRAGLRLCRIETALAEASKKSAAFDGCGCKGREAKGSAVCACGAKTSGASQNLSERQAEQQKERDTEGLLARLCDVGLDAVLVRAFEQLSAVRAISESCKKNAKHLEVVYDYTVYGTNTQAEQELLSLGAERLTMSVELNYKELRRLADAARGRDRECLVYGHLPMMVSANCVLKTVSGCTRRNEITGIKDRMGRTLPVRCYCKFCYNEIYNADPLVLYDLKKELAALAPASLRYDFSVESEKQTAAVLAGNWQAKQLTRGHFRRGVE